MTFKSSYLFGAVSILEIYAEISQNHLLRFICKPLLMLSLMYYYYDTAAKSFTDRHKLMIVAFFFSWIGDVALMLVFKNEKLFLVGLLAFLVTHVLYTIAFNKVEQPDTDPILPRQLWKVAPLMFYMAALFYFLIPAISVNEKTHGLLMPVVVYGVVIANMVAFAINRFGRVSIQSYRWVTIGALLFMLSDSIIAINKFLNPISSASVFIMILYIAGQFLIAKGMLLQQTSSTK